MTKKKASMGKALISIPDGRVLRLWFETCNAKACRNVPVPLATNKNVGKNILKNLQVKNVRNPAVMERVRQQVNNASKFAPKNPNNVAAAGMMNTANGNLPAEVTMEDVQEEAQRLAAATNTPDQKAGWTRWIRRVPQSKTELVIKGTLVIITLIAFYKFYIVTPIYRERIIAFLVTDIPKGAAGVKSWIEETKIYKFIGWGGKTVLGWTGSGAKYTSAKLVELTRFLFFFMLPFLKISAEVGGLCTSILSASGSTNNVARLASIIQSGTKTNGKTLTMREENALFLALSSKAIDVESKLKAATNTGQKTTLESMLAFCQNMQSIIAQRGYKKS